MMKNRYFTEYLKSPIPFIILILTIIFSYIEAPYIDLRNSFSDYIIYQIDGRIIFQFMIFIIWSIFWLNKFQEDTLLEQIRYKDYFKYLKDKFKCILFLTILTIAITLIGILIGGILYKIFNMPSFIRDFIEPSLIFLSRATLIKDIFGEKVIPIAILYVIVGYFFLSALYFYIINKISEEKSKLIILSLIVLEVQMVIVGDMSAYFKWFKYIWFIYPNYYISLPFCFFEKGIYGCLFILAIEIFFIIHFIYKIRCEGIKWIRR